MLTVLVLLSLQSCMTLNLLTGGGKEKFVIKSQPSGATIYIDGQKIGYTPLTTKVKIKDQLVRIELEGYQPYQFELTKKFTFNKFAFGVITDGFWAGIQIISWPVGAGFFAIDLLSGSMYSLTQSEINAELKKNGITSLKGKESTFIIVKNANPNWEKVGTLTKIK